MRRWTWFALAIVLVFTATIVVDRCAEAADEECPPACHFACIDGCAVAPVETAKPPAVPAEATLDRSVELASAPAELDFPPDLIPPRA
jgi:hypothetical protein